MYERSAIVLEKNFNTILGFDQKTNLKTIYKDFKELAEEIENYQQILEEEDKIISEIENICDEVIFLSYGEIALQGNVDEIRAEKQKSIDALFREEFRC